MAPSQTVPTLKVKVEPPVTKTVFDLDSFEEVLLQKPAPFDPVASIDDAVALLNNDATQLLEIVNIGLRAVLRKKIEDNPDIAWLVANEKGETSVFTGTIADNSEVNKLRLNLAKSIYAPLVGGWDSLDNEKKAECKDKAMKYIQSSVEIKTGLQAMAKLAPATE